MQNKKQMYPGAMSDQIRIGIDFDLPLDDLFEGVIEPAAINESGQHCHQAGISVKHDGQGQFPAIEG